MQILQGFSNIIIQLAMTHEICKIIQWIFVYQLRSIFKNKFKNLLINYLLHIILLYHFYLFVEKCSDPGKSFLLNFKEQFWCNNGLQAVYSFAMSLNDSCWETMGDNGRQVIKEIQFMTQKVLRILQRKHLKHQLTISYFDLKLSWTSSSEINKNRCSLNKRVHTLANLNSLD